MGVDPNFSELARELGVSHTLVRQMTDSDHPARSSHIVPALCEKYGVPLFEVLDGISDDELLLLRALDAVRQAKPHRVAGYVEDAVQRAEDISGRKVEPVSEAGPTMSIEPRKGAE